MQNNLSSPHLMIEITGNDVASVPVFDLTDVRWDREDTVTDGIPVFDEKFDDEPTGLHSTVAFLRNVHNFAQTYMT